MSTIYTPPMCDTLDKLPEQQCRVGIQGAPKTGKTFSALTFPNPIVANLDRGLKAYVGRSDIIEIPFWNPTFCDKIHPRNGLLTPPNRKDALITWMRNEGVKLTVDQTFVLDGITEVELAHDLQYSLAPRTSPSTGKVNQYGLYDSKNEYFSELFECLKAMKCNVIVLGHETEDRGDSGELNSLVRPMVNGQFKDKIAGKCTDWFRCHACAKPVNDVVRTALLKRFSIDEKTLKEWEVSTPPECPVIYLWQTQADDKCKCGTASLHNVPKFIPSGYKNFMRYMRKVDNGPTL